MTMALWCVLIAGLLPYAAVMIAKGGAKFDNNNPRDWLAKQEGYRRRANGAQANSFEAFPLFAVAVIVAHVLHGPQARVDTLAIVFIAARVAYLICYIADWAIPRSVAWLVGMVCAVTIFVTGI
jgi:uncharacterized MAPEG superfamily protein